jgi:hypothetical protein
MNREAEERLLQLLPNQGEVDPATLAANGIEAPAPAASR